ncbi:hypothetical protein [Ruminococcus albus]|nr:hypothetical protein [Ruminococcus albus]
MMSIIYCFISYFGYKASMEKCSSVMQGVVTDVDKKSDTRHGYYYIAYVISEEAHDMSFETHSVRHEYTKGESVNIHYAPDDISDYYINSAEPTGQDVSLIFTLVFMLIVVSVTDIVRGKQYRKLCSGQNGSAG